MDAAKPGRPVTLADVARAAGVSPATVSKALNDKPEVSDATRAKVVATAASLGFTPNLQARSLMSGRTGMVGLLTEDLDGRFAIPVLVGAEEALAEVDAVAILTNSHQDPEIQKRHLAALLRHRVDGIIVVGEVPEPRSPLPILKNVPVAYTYSPSTDPRDVSVVADHRGAGRLAAEHLIEQGKTRIAIIGGPLDPRTRGYSASNMRVMGASAALKEAGLHVIGGAPRFGEYSDQWGWQASSELLDEGVAFDGLICANDHVSRGAVELLRTRGLSLPADVAVIGFDDWGPVADTARMGLSSVSMELYEIGRRAARAVLEPETTEPGEHLVPGRVVARESTIGR
jgi:LacI family transcriptional regulator